MYLLFEFVIVVVSDNLSSYFTDHFKLDKNIHSHKTRSASNIHIDYKRTDYQRQPEIRSRSQANRLWEICNNL